MEVYSRGHVTIDDSFARFGAKSYAINKITSVEVRTHERVRSGWLFFAIFGGIAMLMGIGSLSTPEKGGSALFIGVGIALLAGAYFQYRSRITRNFQLILATASGEVQATTSLDPEAIAELRDAIEARVAAA